MYHPPPETNTIYLLCVNKNEIYIYVKIKIQTHAINGLHESDFVLAAKIDKIN